MIERIPLPRGRELVVRPMVAADATRLMALYEGLSDTDRRMRFFSVYRPRQRWLERWATIGERDGFGVVAVLTEPGADSSVEGEIVADAGYTLLANGNGEFALTVSPSVRGWLGPYLLDLLAGAAGDRGIGALEADILFDNRKMLALVRSRGYVIVAPGLDVLRVAIGTRGRLPEWPRFDGRPRVLVETPGAHWFDIDAARASGLQVLTCGGPRTMPSCPAMRGEACPLAQGADAVVFNLRPNDADAQQIMAVHHREHRRLFVSERLGWTPDPDDIPVRTSASAVKMIVERLATVPTPE